MVLSESDARLRSYPQSDCFLGRGGRYMGGWGETTRIRFQRSLNPKGLRHRVPRTRGGRVFHSKFFIEKNKNFFVPSEQIVIWGRELAQPKNVTMTMRQPGCANVPHLE